MKPRAAWATDRAVRRLTAMWIAGDVTKVISEELGVTKNMVINMARTLQLEARPSPIPGGPSGGEPKRHAPRRRRPEDALFARRPVTVLPALARDRANPALSALDAPLPVNPFPPSTPVPDAPRAKARPPRAPAATPIRRVARRVEPCCWVVACRTGVQLPRYCEADSMAGLPYCVEHAELAYPGVKQRRQEQAATGGI